MCGKTRLVTLRAPYFRRACFFGSRIPNRRLEGHYVFSFSCVSKKVSPSGHPMQSYLTQILHQLPPELPNPNHEQPLQPHSASAVEQFGRLADQSPLTGCGTKRFMTAGGLAANSTWRKSSTTTEGDDETTSAVVACRTRQWCCSAAPRTYGTFVVAPRTTKHCCSGRDPEAPLG